MYFKILAYAPYYACTIDTNGHTNSNTSSSSANSTSTTYDQPASPSPPCLRNRVSLLKSRLAQTEAEIEHCRCSPVLNDTTLSSIQAYMSAVEQVAQLGHSLEDVLKPSENRDPFGNLTQASRDLLVPVLQPRSLSSFKQELMSARAKIDQLVKRKKAIQDEINQLSANLSESEDETETESDNDEIFEPPTKKQKMSQLPKYTRSNFKKLTRHEITPYQAKLDTLARSLDVSDDMNTLKAFLQKTWPREGYCQHLMDLYLILRYFQEALKELPLEPNDVKRWLGHLPNPDPILFIEEFCFTDKDNHGRRGIMVCNFNIFRLMGSRIKRKQAQEQLFYSFAFGTLFNRLTTMVPDFHVPDWVPGRDIMTSIRSQIQESGPVEYEEVG